MTDNYVHVEGNLTRDPELRFTSAGAAVANIGIAVNNSYFDNALKRRVEHTDYFDAEVWNDLGKHVAESLQKGHRVTVDGRLKLSTWTTPEGDPRSKVVIVAQGVNASMRFHTVTPVKAERAPSPNGSEPVPAGGVPSDEFAEEEPF